MVAESLPGSLRGSPVVRAREGRLEGACSVDTEGPQVQSPRVDDFGVEYLDEKGRFRTTLEKILSRRFARMRFTMLTTNIVDPAIFAERYGDRIASRLHEDGAFIVCEGPDLRRAST